MNIYIVTRMSENKSDAPNLGVHTSWENAEDHFNYILEDRKGDNKKYKCNIHWDIKRVLRNDDISGCIREAYIEHPETDYQETYVEMLRIEWYYKDSKDVLLDLI